MTIDDAARLLIVLACCDWVLTGVIYKAARSVDEPALTERATTSVILSFVATLAAILAAARLGVLELGSGVGLVLLIVAFVFVSAPQFIWAIGLVTGRFR